MHHRIWRTAAACTIVVLGLVASQGTSGAATVLSLKSASGRYDTTTFKSLGNSKDAQAGWTNKVALNGKFSMALTKSTNDQYAFAAAIVKGVEGKTIADLGDIAFSFSGVCEGGSPRFNLYYDNNADGVADGVAFYGCNNASPSSPAPGWSRVSFDASAPAFEYNFTTNLPSMTDASTVVQLSVLIDIVGSVNIDDVTAAGATVGEP